MLLLAWSNFAGANIKLTPRRLPDGVGINAVNLRPGFSDMRPWRGAGIVKTTVSGSVLRTLWRMNRTVVSDVADWLQWPQDIDIVRSLNPSDSTEEIFYTGDGAPKRTDNILALPASTVPAASRSLGVPKPTAAMAATIATAGTGTDQSRAYVDTFKTSQDRESAPGLPRQIVCKPDATVTLDTFDPVPSGYPDVTLRCLYVSVDGSEYRKVAEIAVGATSHLDSGTRGDVLGTGGTNKPAHEMPPSGLRGLIELWNGMVGGFVGKQFAVCEPGKPWAWPVEYQDTAFDTIIGTGRWASNWVLLTASAPIILRGGPELFDRQPVALFEACSSKSSVVSFPDGVCWASPRGLCYVGERGAFVLTEATVSEDQWAALNPSSMVGCRLGNHYVGFFNDGTARGFMVDITNPLAIVFLSQGAVGTYFDPVSARLYLADGSNNIRRWNHASADPLVATFELQFRKERDCNPGWAVVIADEPVSVDFTLLAYMRLADGSFVWAEIFDRTVDSGIEFALPAGYTAQEFRVRLAASGPVQGVQLAEDPGDFI